MPKPNVFVAEAIPESGISLLKKKCNVTISRKNRVLTKKELMAAIRGKDALLSMLTDRIDDAVLQANPRLRIVANYAVGYDNIDVKAATKRGILVTNTPGVLTDAVADHTCALLLAASRRIVEADTYLRAGKYTHWGPILLLGNDFRGKTLGIVGAGRIGTAVAERMASGFGMKVAYHNVRRNPLIEKAAKARFATLPQILKQADYVSIHVPLLPSTQHLISAKELRMMKRTAILVNTSRGPVVDERALVSALKRKQIAGAALDVFEREPKLTPGLAKLDNVTLTPHIASATVAAREAMSTIAAKNILAVLAGRKAPNTVNPEVYTNKRMRGKSPRSQNIL